MRVRSGTHAGRRRAARRAGRPPAVRARRAARGGVRRDRRAARRSRSRSGTSSASPDHRFGYPRGDARHPSHRTRRGHDDAEATRALAARLAAVARPGDLLCLVGELGAGKTQFAKGFAVGLGITDTVSSPTFVLMTEYAGRLPMFHIDLYRLDDAADALAGGLLDERQLEGVALVEWAERLGPGAAARAAGRRDRRLRRRAAVGSRCAPATTRTALPRGGGVTPGDGGAPAARSSSWTRRRRRP